MQGEKAEIATQAVWNVISTQSFFWQQVEIVWVSEDDKCE